MVGPSLQLKATGDRIVLPKIFIPRTRGNLVGRIDAARVVKSLLVVAVVMGWFLVATFPPIPERERDGGVFGPGNGLDWGVQMFEDDRMVWEWVSDLPLNYAILWDDQVLFEEHHVYHGSGEFEATEEGMWGIVLINLGPGCATIELVFDQYVPIWTPHGLFLPPFLMAITVTIVAIVLTVLINSLERQKRYFAWLMQFYSRPPQEPGI